MKRTLLKLTAIFLAVLLMHGAVICVHAEEVLISETNQEGSKTVFGVEEGSLELPCKSAILMEEKTGEILYMQNADEALPPASVTKIMTLLLIMEAVDAGIVHMDSTVTVSANAASMGGSQIYLKEGEKMTLEELLKSVVIASANDAAVALAEHLCGSVGTFVEKMNKKAKSLGMESTFFENPTGLDDTAEKHLTSAKDIAIMSRALIAHSDVLKYSSIWMDTIRNGEFGLTNTNRLVRFYEGCTGLKTGSTSKAGFCVSATARREGLSLICVIMGAESRDIRNNTATRLLDWGFSKYAMFTSEEGTLTPIKVIGGNRDTCPLSYPSFDMVVEKEKLSSIKKAVVLPEKIYAPIKKGDTVGAIEFSIDKKNVASIPLVASEEIPKISFFEIFGEIFLKFLLI